VFGESKCKNKAVHDNILNIFSQIKHLCVCEVVNLELKFKSKSLKSYKDLSIISNVSFFLVEKEKKKKEKKQQKKNITNI